MLSGRARRRPSSLARGRRHRCPRRPCEVFIPGVACLGRTVLAREHRASPPAWTARVLVDVAALRWFGTASRSASGTPSMAGPGRNQLADRVGLSPRASWASIWPVLSFLGGEAVALGVIWWVVGLAALAGIVMPADSQTPPLHPPTKRTTHSPCDFGRSHWTQLSPLPLGGHLVRVPGRQRAGGDRGQLDGAGLYRSRRPDRRYGLTDLSLAEAGEPVPSSPRGVYRSQQ